MRILKRLIKRFKDREYRHSYAESFVDSYLATQLKALREQRGLTQQQLAELANVKQSQICRWESANNTSWQIRSLKNLARAMDLVLVVKFQSFSEMVPDIESFGRQALQRHSYANDPLFTETVAVADAELLIPSETDGEAADSLYHLPNLPPGRAAQGHEGGPRAAHAEWIAEPWSGTTLDLQWKSGNENWISLQQQT